MTTTMTIEEAGLLLADPLSYTDEERLHRGLALLRREAPVHLVTAPGYRPFYAVTRHADIMEVERDGALWLSEPRPALAPLASERANAGFRVRTLVNMDDPDHRVVRAIGADWFRPRAMRMLEARVRELAREHVDRMASLGGECDFAADIAVHYPLYVILSLLGMPESDFPKMLQLTRELFGAQDEEFGRDAGKDQRMSVLMDFFAYFQELTAARRADPTDDLASAIANAVVDGQPLNDVETMSYYVIIATAGHDTTSSTIAGGLQALLANPGELARLRDDPALLPTAADEMIRWVTPSRSSCARRRRAPCWAGCRSRRASRSCCPTRPPTATRRCSPIRSGSTSAATPTATSRSGSARTTASAPRWRRWRPAPCSPSCCRGWSPSSSRGSRSGPPPPSSAASSTCPSATGCAADYLPGQL